MKNKRFLWKLLITVLILSLSIPMVACQTTDKPAETTAKPQAAETKAKAAETDAPKAEDPEKGDAQGDGFALANPESKLVYVIAAARENAYFDAIYTFTEKRAKELGYEVVAVSHDDDVQKESQLFDTAISAKAVAIICDNAGSDASIENVRKAHAAGVAVFLLDREINESGLAMTQITADNYTGSVAVAEAFVEAMGEKGKYVELVGKESDTQSKIRSDAFHEIIDQYEEIEMVARQSADWDRNDAYSKIESIIQANPDIQGIVCGNDDMALGALAAVNAAGLKDVVIVGFDGIQEVVEAIRKGDMVASAMDQVGVSATMCVDQMHSFITTGSTGFPEKQLVPCLLVTKDNADKVEGFVLQD